MRTYYLASVTTVNPQGNALTLPSVRARAAVRLPVRRVCNPLQAGNAGLPSINSGLKPAPYCLNHYRGVGNAWS